MNNLFETPHSFSTNQRLGEDNIVYTNIREIAQGGPLVGNLWVNDICIGGQNSFFGGPLLVQGRKIVIPIFIRRFCVAGFKLSIVDIATHEVNTLGKIRDLIFLDSIAGSEITYFLDLDKNKKEIYIQ